MPLQIRRGTTAGLPATPAEGEPLFNTQTQELLIGTGSGSVAMAKKTHTHAIADVTNLQITLDAKVATINSVAPTSGNITLNLDQLGDVIVTAPTNTQILQYDGSNWVNQSLQVSTNLDGLSDVTITSPTTGQVLKYNGTAWVNDTDATGGAGVTDGDKGDINVTGTGATWTVKNDAVTFAKMQNIATDRLLGRATAGSGDVEEITCTAAGRAILDDADAAAQRATLGAVGTATTVSPGTGLTGGGALSSNVTLSIDFAADGAATANKAVVATDARLSNARTPTTHVHSGADITSGTVGLAYGGTGTTLASTGGSKQYLKQTTSGGAVTVGTIAMGDLGTGTTDSTTYLRGDGTWATVSATGGGTKTLARWTALDNHPPATAYATFDTRNSVAVLDFDHTAEEAAVFVGIVPEGTTFASGSSNAVTVRLFWTTAATTGSVRWGAQFDKLATNEAVGGGAYDTAIEGTTAVGGTAGYPVFTELTFTGNDLGDTLAAGDAFRLKVYRDVADAADTVNSNDAELIAVEMRLV